MELTTRKQKILAAVVNLYIVTGEPVGSKALCEVLDFNVSSATVRNEMSSLAEMGLLEQPHTSAGRIPSQNAYRYYVEALLPKYTLSVEERSVIDSVLFDSAYDPEKLMSSVSRALAAYDPLRGGIDDAERKSGGYPGCPVCANQPPHSHGGTDDLGGNHEDEGFSL